MQRAITGYHQDAGGDWVAELGCGHDQAARSAPPLEPPSWVLTPEGRASMLGIEVDCGRCDRFELPEGAVPYKRTAELDETTIPAGLRAHHSTKPGVWGVIHVLEGRLRYVLEPPLAGARLLDPAQRGIVVPEVKHHVEPDGPVRFFVEFHRKPAT